MYAEFPDHSARIRAVELWLEQGFGKPGTTSAAPVVPGMSRPFEEMRSEELEAIIAAAGDDSDPHDVSGVDWVARAQDPRRPNPGFVKGAP